MVATVQTRFEVDVGATASHSRLEHVRIGSHARFDVAVGAADSNSLELHTRTGEHTLLLDAVIGTDSNCAGRTQEVYGLHVASVVSDAAMDVYSVPFTGHADGVNAVHGVMSSAARQ